MNLTDEIEFLEIVAGILAQEDNRSSYTLDDWINAENILKESGVD